MKPGIIVTSKDTDDVFEWLSVDWNRMEVSHTPEAKELFRKAKKAIAEGKDVPDAIRLLEEAGFEITRS